MQSQNTEDWVQPHRISLFNFDYTYKVSFNFPKGASCGNWYCPSTILCRCCGPNFEKLRPVRNLEQQGYGCDPQKTHDHFPQVTSCMWSFIGPRVPTRGLDSIWYESRAKIAYQKNFKC